MIFWQGKMCIWKPNVRRSQSIKSLRNLKGVVLQDLRTLHDRFLNNIITARLTLKYKSEN